MSRRKPRFEVVRSDAGWFARFVGANGRKVWQTEVYARPLAAFHAIALITGEPVRVHNGGFEVKSWALAPETVHLEVREVDERTGA